MLKLSRLGNTAVHLMQSSGHRSFWIWCSYSLTAVLLPLSALLVCGDTDEVEPLPPDDPEDDGDLRERAAALLRCSSVSLV